MKAARLSLIWFLVGIMTCVDARALGQSNAIGQKSPSVSPTNDGPPAAVDPASSASPHNTATKLAESNASRPRESSASAWLQRYPGVITFAGSVIALVASICFFVMTRRQSIVFADRTVRIEAQKLLLEINKQFLANPALLGVYDENFEKLPFEKRKSNDFKLSLRALALMKLNVFEIVFAVHPAGRRRAPWEKYFKDSLEKCSPLREVLDKYNDMYSDDLIEAYGKIAKDLPYDLRCPSLEGAPVSIPRRKRLFQK